jgi:hypothetical protein
VIDITHDPRAAMEIRRYHTWRTLRSQSNGEHSCQIIRIMLCIWPEVPRKLIVHAAMHDVGEMAGDIPYPFKKNNPKLRDEHGKAEREVYTTMADKWGLPRLTVLSHDEEKFFKMCEYLEMWEYGISEQRMGNSYAAMISERCILMASKLALELPETIRNSATKYTAMRQEQENPNEAE